MKRICFRSLLVYTTLSDEYQKYLSINNSMYAVYWSSLSAFFINYSDDLKASILDKLKRG